jgi:long-chain acyl-CoA synthetase
VTTGRPAHLGEYLAQAAERRPNHPALLVGASRLTWSELDRRATQCAAGMRAAGVHTGDRVGLFLRNRPELVIAYYGALRAGAVVVPVNAGLTAPELSVIAEHVGLALLVVDRTTAAVAAAAVPEVPAFVVGTSTGPGSFQSLLAGDPPALPEAPGGEALAMVIYTSGQSGDPKGAMLTHRALAANVEQVAAAPVPVVQPDDVVLVLLPLSHVYSLAGTLGALTRAAATGVIVDPVDAGSALPLARQYRVTNVPGAPSLWSAWASEPEAVEILPQLRIAFSGSAELPVEVQHRIHALTGWYVHEGYGLTEAAPGVSSTVVSGRAKPGSVGRPFSGVSVRLLDDDGDQLDTSEGDPGEVWIRGDNLFSGYWPDGDDGPDEEGWFCTGDVAFVDDDGDLHLVDRRKDVIIVSGFNVYPREVEQALLEHPGVREAAVVGVPDERSGEAVTAFVVVDDGVSVADVQQHAATRLARFKQPQVVQLVASLPHSASGQVARGRLEQGRASASTEEPA